MTEEPKNESAFLVQISRELGAIFAKLDAIFTSINLQTKEIDTLWGKVYENSKEMNSLKIKVAVIATAISVLLNAPNIFQIIKGL